MKQLLESGTALLRWIVRGISRAARSLWALLGPAPGWSGLQRWLLQIATLGVLVGIGGFLFAASGIMPINASSGHWPITVWFLNFSMSRSVSTHSLGINVPDLSDNDLVLKGAGHYETGCFPCHGSPVLKQPRIARAMTPHPPYLPPAIHEWDPEELFYIVKHGVKFTGMPAWPTQQRDDEVWAMVAFLQKFPELDLQKYQQLVHGETAGSHANVPLQGLAAQAAPRAVIESCQRCHGADGQARGTGGFPNLTGQQPEYFEAAMLAFASGDRHSGIMGPIAAGLSRNSTHELGQYYHRITVAKPTPSRQATSAAVQRGESIARQGVPNQRVPICAECHGPGANKRNTAYPNLAGQHSKYLVLQLELFKSRRRGGSSYAHLMYPVADRLTPDQMRDVALFYESLSIESPSEQ